MTALYQNVLLCFLRRDVQKYEPSSTTLIWEALNESYALELLSLGAIAWLGIQVQQQILSASPLNKALALVLSDYPEVSKSKLERVLTHALSLGFVRHGSDEKETTPLLQRRYYFLTSLFRNTLLPIIYYRPYKGDGERGLGRPCETGWSSINTNPVIKYC